MQYSVEFDIHTFSFWSGAKDVVDAFRKADRLDDLAQLITDVFSDKTPTTTEINDFVWFSVPEMEDIEETYGVKL